MSLKDIVAVSGMPGLYKMAGNRNNGLIVEDLDTGKRKFAPSRSHQFTPLESIAIFTITEEDSIELAEVFKKMKAGKAEHPVANPNGSQDELRIYFDAVLPEYDEDRVKTSDIKKVIKWFSFLEERGLLEVEEEEKDEPEEPEEGE